MVAYIDGKCLLLLTSILLIWLWPRSRLGAVVGGSDVLLPDGAPVDVSDKADDEDSTKHSSRRRQLQAALQMDMAPAGKLPSSSRDQGPSASGGSTRQRRRTAVQQVQLDESGWVEIRKPRSGLPVEQIETFLDAEVRLRDVTLHRATTSSVSGGDVMKSRSTLQSSASDPAQLPGHLPAQISKLPWMRWPVRALVELAVWSGLGPHLAQYWNVTLGVVAQARLPTELMWQDALLLRTLCCTVALIAALLLLCATYDTARNWRYRMNLKRVQEKVCRANEVFLGLHGNQLLCPCCVEFVPTASASTIAFLCGHTFHVGCANEWYRRHSNSDSDTPPGRCPVCEGPQSCLHAGRSEQKSCSVSEDRAEIGGRLQDSARLFSLHCLAENFPSVITKDLLEQLASQRPGTILTGISFSKVVDPKA